MNQDSMNGRSAWYQPLRDEAPEGQARSLPADAAPHPTHLPPRRSAGPSPSGGDDYRVPYWTREEAVRKKKKRAGLRAAAAGFGLVVLIAASALLFSRDGGDPAAAGSAPPASAEGTPGGYDGYSDFREFFEHYYDETQTITGQNDIPRAQTGTGVTLPTAPEPEGEALSLGEIYEQCAPYVVAITAETGGSSYYWGSGIVMTADGYIITNTHILDGTSAVTVTLHDDRRFEARLVGADAVSDLSVLKIEATGLTAAVFCADPVHQGDEVVAIGNPLGEELRGTMTNGIISAISRDISYNRHSMTLIQTNAAINEGNSGGPLINMYGQVVGVTNMKMMSSSSLSSVEGIGFAIPVETIESIVNALIAGGSVTGRPAIGITVGPIPENAASYYDLPAGLYISEVSAGSDAEAKGVQVGDILTAVNGIPVTTTDEVAAIKNGLSTGDSLALTLFRGGETFTVEVRLVETSDIY